ncbi:helix-turn-helix domain-containing protein [Sphingobium cupriresistens]|uniref:Uncharacterized protein n=1 Tax=Sphingobium cupriresistens LL01 TaxID=1420583 RepID=A0A0J7Y4K8_9SPHN|nr:hypothetical protein [Sphingobium cupriresistens]KMS58861.1 hypothetical protein V473_10755 [Sphingobium cupriresistens LL01]
MTARAFGELAFGFLERKESASQEKPPRRWSYDQADRRAQVFRRVGDGSKEQGWSLIGAMMQAFDETLQQQRIKGYKGKDRLQDGDRRILLTLLKRLDFKTGRLDPSYAEIAAKAGCHRNTAIKACYRFVRWLGLRWVRRTAQADTAGQKGPQREQISNAFFFEIRSLPSRVKQRWREAVKRHFAKKGQQPPKTITNYGEGVRPVDNPIWHPEFRSRIEAEDRRGKAGSRQLNERLEALGRALDKAANAGTHNVHCPRKDI